MLFRLINDPSNPTHYWRYRMHMTVSALRAERTFNAALTDKIRQSGR